MTNDQPNSQQYEPCFYERWFAELLNATLPFVSTFCPNCVGLSVFDGNAR